MFNLALFRSVFVFAFTNVLAAGLPLLLLPVLTRILTPEDYGLVAMYSVVLTALGALTGLSVHGAVGMRYFDREDIDFPLYVGSCLVTLFVTTAIVLSVVGIGRTFLTSMTSLPMEWLLIGVLTSCFQFVFLVRLSIFQSAKQAGLFGIFRVGQATIDAVLSVVLVLCTALAWQGRLIGISIAIVLLGFVSSVSLFRGGWIALGYRGDYAMNALKFGLPLVPHVVGGVFLSMADRVMITNVVGVSSTGVYMVAVQLGLGVYLAADACNRAASPFIIEAVKEASGRKDRLIVVLCYAYFTALLLLSLAIGLLAPWLLSFLVGEAFREAAPLVLVLALGQAFAGMYLIIANVIFYRQKTVHLAAITISCGCLNALLSYLLLQVFGVAGATYAYLTAQFVMFLATLILSQKLYPLPWFSALGKLKGGRA